jgi:ABC-type branched-subunit amino acid transport system ATPase component
VKGGEVILSVEDVSLAFGGVKALQGVSFDVRKHEVRAIIGPNGAGKSSMLNVLNGVYHPQRGKIRYKGRDIAGERVVAIDPLPVTPCTLERPSAAVQLGNPLALPLGRLATAWR